MTVFVNGYNGRDLESSVNMQASRWVKKMRERHFGGRLEPVLFIVFGEWRAFDHMEGISISSALTSVLLRLVQH